MTLTTMITLYDLFAAAHLYILGFVLYGRVYYTMMDFATIRRYFTLDHASTAKGGGAKIRLKVKAKEKRDLLKVSTAIGLAEDLTGNGYNLGDNFERLIVERVAGKHWKKDSTPFNLSGDVTINGQEVQVKFDGATLVTEKTLLRLTATR